MLTRRRFLSLAAVTLVPSHVIADAVCPDTNVIEHDLEVSVSNLPIFHLNTIENPPFYPTLTSEYVNSLAQGSIKFCGAILGSATEFPLNAYVGDMWLIKSECVLLGKRLSVGEWIIFSRVSDKPTQDDFIVFSGRI